MPLLPKDVLDNLSRLYQPSTLKTCQSNLKRMFRLVFGREVTHATRADLRLFVDQPTRVSNELGALKPQPQPRPRRLQTFGSHSHSRSDHARDVMRTASSQRALLGHLLMVLRAAGFATSSFPGFNDLTVYLEVLKVRQSRARESL